MAEINSMDILSEAIEKYSPRHIIALFSGGHDSLVSTHYVLQRYPDAIVAHINTGIGIEETRIFVRQTVDDWNKELIEVHAIEYRQRCGKPDPQIYEDIVLEHGFPGPAQHSTFYRRLKERPIRALIRDLERKSKDRVLLVTGVRKSESKRRMGTVEPIQEWPKEATKVWVAPITYWSIKDIFDYIREYNLPRNQVSDLLHGSKECLCGAYAHPGELDEIELWYPEMAKYIKGLQKRVKKAGKHWEWGKAPPKKISKDQLILPSFNENILCSGCINE
jgi:3'-phosphoadenosine 5'-phosphosulfate sulfotransferase (PAPS reductase)/FAD synthetase